MTIQILTHADCLTHEPGAGHPENPERLANVLNALHNTAINTSLSFHDAPLGTDAQILLAHETSHLERIRETAPDEGEAALDADTRMSPGSLNATLRAVGAACQGVDNLMTENTGAVFCATRPPGHHATPTHAMGFCLFNHVAIAALHAREQYKLERIAIVDFDVHHGNGTQDIMQGREGVFYISTHQSPLYPGTGLEAENINNNIKYIVLSANNYPKANNYLISLYSKRVFLIKNIFFRLVLIPLSLISYICKNTFEFDGCSKNTKSKEIYNESLKK